MADAPDVETLAKVIGEGWQQRRFDMLSAAHQDRARHVATLVLKWLTRERL